MNLCRAATVGLILLLLPAMSVAQERQDDTSRVIVVLGEGVVKVTPDRAWIRVGAESRSKGSKEAQQRNAEVMTAIQSKLASFSIPKDAIRTVGVDLQLEIDYRDGKQTPRGYVARNTVEVRVDDLARVGDILDAVVASGATTVHGLRFDTKERALFEQSALQAAVKNGMAKAQALALGSGQALDRVVRIEEQFAGGSVDVMQRTVMMEAGNQPTPVAPGEIEIRASVRVTFSMK